MNDLEVKAKYVWNHPEVREIVAHRIIGTLEWCALAHESRELPGWVFADIVISCQAEADNFGVWNRVCATLMARGHNLFHKFIHKETAHA